MTEDEASQIQNSINVLQEMLDAHREAVNYIRPQEKGLKSYMPKLNVSWKLEGGILHHIEIINCGNVDINAVVYQMYSSNLNIDISMDAYGMPIGQISVLNGDTEGRHIGYPCNPAQPIMIEIKDASDDETLDRIRVE